MSAYFQKRRLAFTLVEVILALAILVYAAFAFLTTYQKSISQEVQSQNRGLALRIARASLEEWKDHPFGSPPCSDWGFSDAKDKESEWLTAPACSLVVEGKQVSVNFHVKRLVQSGAIFGASKDDYDVVTTVVSWSEGRVRNQIDYGQFSSTFYQNDDQHAVVQNPVMR